ncbi:MAG TPA: ABC transporter permease subunit [Aggregatilineales bacterium]|nr:ABC transporter permease subunit [Anaerolineales bacterium]HRE46620.1 ABC transporter permease subunit [Aggregatilineales bacterium]
MTAQKRVFGTPVPTRPLFSVGDAVVLLVLGALIFFAARLALNAPAVIQGPTIRLETEALPYYALLSVGRMLAAYALSLLFSLAYGYSAARSKSAERLLMPALDILQSIPILSFLPVVLLTLISILPSGVAVELAAIILIFTSQAWNMTYSFYQSMKTQPRELREASKIFRLNGWLRFRRIDMPFAAVGLIWNSVMSWAGGWFFLMAAEIFRLGDRDFRLPGLGAYLQTAADQGNTQALWLGIATLIALIVMLDQLVWRPLLAWAERFKMSQVSNENAPESWFLTMLRRTALLERLNRQIVLPVVDRVNKALTPRAPDYVASLDPAEDTVRRSLLGWLLLIILSGAAGYALVQAAGMVVSLPLTSWGEIALGALATSLRVACAVIIALAWTIPVGVLIGTNPAVARFLQPIVQILASIPATALFPALLLGLLNVPGGANIAAVLLMLLGTQWYLLFNIIAGASAIPQDLHDTSDFMRLHGWKRWRTLILPGLFPYIITGLITSSGGAWNASIVSEYTEFAGKTTTVTGLGALITQSTASENHALLLASTLTMVLIVVFINRFVWRRLYRLAEDRFRLEQ